MLLLLLFPPAKTNPSDSPPLFFPSFFSFLVHASSPKGTGADQRPNDSNSNKTAITLCSVSAYFPPSATDACLPYPFPRACDRHGHIIPGPLPSRSSRSFATDRPLIWKAKTTSQKTTEEAKKKKKKKTRNRVVHIGRRQTFQILPPRFIHTYIPHSMNQPRPIAVQHF